MIQDFLQLPVRVELSETQDSQALLLLALGVSIGFGAAATAWAAGVRPTMTSALAPHRYVVSTAPSEEKLRDAPRFERRPSLGMTPVEDSTVYVAAPPAETQRLSRMSNGVFARYQASVGSQDGGERNDFRTR